jgi:diaminohydroxyphosphoribosylaminopyrimidine deaminase/5-amino-6-(5-phosphoribosylamino)uracil reductase
LKLETWNMKPENKSDSEMMQRALELARRGQGFVEPNPMVGCVIASGGQVVGEGWHQRFGEPHAEIEALAAAGPRARGGQMFVTLEPCCHQGKTPACAPAVIAAGISRVVVAMSDPFPQVAGGGLAQLAAAGIQTEVGLHEAEARELNAPYLKFLSRGRPWVIAKWAMTLDGKIATAGGQSRWISGAASRAVVHQLRSRVDAVVIGRRTAELDDPLLTARLENAQPPRISTRIVLDSLARLPTTSQLVRTARQQPTLIAASPSAAESDQRRLAEAGSEVLFLTAEQYPARICELLDELGRRRMTNILVEGGSELLGAFRDAGEIDEVHVFIAPKLFGGAQARSPIGGGGIQAVADAWSLRQLHVESLEGDLYLSGRVARR